MWRAQEKSFKNKGLGDAGENLACDYLVERGFRILTRNYVCTRGEIDIIAEKDGEIHFIEVKTRTSKSLESALEAVTPRKMERVRIAARMWLHDARNSFKGIDDKPCIFSVIGIDLTDDWPEVELIEDAFV